MIEYHYELDFKLSGEGVYSAWLNRIVSSEQKVIDHLNYIFCTDAYLLRLNRKYLNHNTLTDILTFDYSKGSELRGDIFISVERIRENADDLRVDFEGELLRVMAHGVLHICGYGDKSDVEIKEMRIKEEEKMKMFHVEH